MSVKVTIEVRDANGRDLDVAREAEFPLGEFISVVIAKTAADAAARAALLLLMPRTEESS